MPGSEGIYGMFVSMAVLVQHIDTRQGFGELARAVQRQMLDDRDHLLATPYDTDNAQLGALNTIFSLQNGIELNGRVGEADLSRRGASSADVEGGSVGGLLSAAGRWTGRALRI